MSQIEIEGEPLRMPAEYWTKIEAQGRITALATALDGEDMEAVVGEADPSGPWEPPFITYDEFLARRS